MKITYDEKNRVFGLENDHIGYYMAIVDEEGFLAHLHYGKKISTKDELCQLLRIKEPPFLPSGNKGERCAFNDSFFWEYPVGGTGDFRESCLNVKNELGQTACSLSFKSYEILKGKPSLKGLPATWGKADDCETLLIHCEDKILNLSVTLSYTIFDKIDGITRSAKITNCGDKILTLTKAYSACLDMDNQYFDFISLHGSWGRERHIERSPLHHGKTSVSSLRGETSHQENNFFALASKTADYEQGEVFGFSLVYSGNFISQAEINQFDYVRAVTGIHSEGFEWSLPPKEEFTSPEAVIIYSDEGLGKMQRNFHALWNNHLIRSPWKNKERPVLINNWEATYFDFTAEKLISIAEKAAQCGIEMLVMDDGWFGKRNKDNSSLGDWIVNKEKLPGGLERLADRINTLGMKFGIWMEPEMISPDSELYRAHPDWALSVAGREHTLSRNQCVLDFTRKEVRDYIFDTIKNILSSASIAYMKWDMNRVLTNVGSICAQKEKSGELHHRYLLGVYELQERLVSQFPDLLLENCSAGGARFDPGMLYYSPQIWCSDDMDPIERLSIQEGSCLVYPPSSMGAHIGASPNHSCGRKTPFMTRAFVALSGTFGYELDLRKLSEKELALVPHQVELYKAHNELVRSGDYYRIASYSENHEWDSWIFVSGDKTKAMLTIVQVLNHPNFHSRKIRIPGLKEESLYKISMECSDGSKSDLGKWHGDTLMNAGLLLPLFWGDFQSAIVNFEEA